MLKGRIFRLIVSITYILEVLNSKYNDEITERIIFRKLERAKVGLQYNEEKKRMVTSYYILKD